MAEFEISQCLLPLDDTTYDELRQLSTVVFDSEAALDGRWRLSNMPCLTCFVARIGEQMIGFKVGYAHTSLRYYSWLGGVHPGYRSCGIADALMRRQHEWLATQPFQVLETEVRAANKAMLGLNLKHGFSVIGEKRVNDNPILILRKPIG